MKNLIKGRWGVYTLYKKNKLYYVGLANNLMGRLKTHLKDRHRGAWDRFSVYLTIKSSHIKELESLLIRVTNPPGNKLQGKFINSKALKRDLVYLLKVHDDNKRASLIGGSYAKRRQKTLAKKAGGKNSLEGIFNKRVKLKAKYKGITYWASIRKDGKINYNNKLYLTPTSAAKAITKRSTISGWEFWHYKDDKNKWVCLNKLRE
uniref:GIY-YIG nuclease family protein n=1 Tax=Ignavibacterium album TaxID=591197 RepID=A0A7V3E7M3_9BACT